MAMKLPFSNLDAVEAYVSAMEKGVQLSKEDFAILVDKSAQAKKPIADLIDLMSNARLGKIDGLDAFDIDATKSKAGIMLRWVDRTGKRMTRLIQDDSRTMQRALLDIWTGQSKGAAEDYGHTLAGIWIHAKNRYNQFTALVAKAGIYDKVKKKLDAWMDKLDQLADNGKLADWADLISGKLETMFDKATNFIENTDWQSVASGMGAIVDTLTSIIGLIGRAATAWSNWEREKKIRMLGATEGDWFNSAETKSRARAERKKLEGQRGGKGPGILNRSTREVLFGRKPKPRARPQPSWGGNVQGRARNNRLRPSASNRPRPNVGAGRANRPQQVAVGGRIEIGLTAPREMKPRVTAMRQDGDVPMTVKLGRSNAGAA